MENTLSIIGGGRVGRALGRRLRELGWKIGAVTTRSEASARRAELLPALVIAPWWRCSPEESSLGIRPR